MFSHARNVPPVAPSAEFASTGPRVRRAAPSVAKGLGAIRGRFGDLASSPASETAGPLPALHGAPATLVRKCAECSEEEKDDTAAVRRQAIGSPDGPARSAAPPVVHDVLCTPGQPLDVATRAFFEPRFGRDFSKVRIHADPTAARSARAVNSHAYTVGEHVVFGLGKFVPHSQSGRTLIAHELAHVLQQAPNPANGGVEYKKQECSGSDRGGTGTMQPKLAVGAVDSPLEREADLIADHVMRIADPRPLLAAPRALDAGVTHLAPQSVIHRPAVPDQDPARHRQPDDLLPRGGLLSIIERNPSGVRVDSDDLAAAAAAGDTANTVGPPVVSGTGMFAPATQLDGHLTAEPANSLEHGADRVGGGSVPHSGVGVGVQAVGGGPAVQRQATQPAAVELSDIGTCGWIDKKDVERELSRRDKLINENLPTANIPNDAELEGYLKRWRESTRCIELAAQQYFQGKEQTAVSAKGQEQYALAIKTIFFQAAGAKLPAMPDLVKKHSGSIRPDALAEVLRFAQLDPAERLDPGPGNAAQPGPSFVLDKLNPGDRMGRWCGLDCPAEAAAVQNYLHTGDLKSSGCKPGQEPLGYKVDPDPDTWGPAKQWPATLKDITSKTHNHGQFVVVVADPEAVKPDYPHYFIVLNIKGKLFVVDGYGRPNVYADIEKYLDDHDFAAKPFRIAPGAITVTAVADH